MSARGGFSLVEVLFAVLVLQVGVLGTLSLLNGALEMVREAEEIEWSIDRAVSIVDSIRRGRLPGSGFRRERGMDVEWGSDPGWGSSLVVRRSADGAPRLALPFSPQAAAR